ncbi:hypothetical protein GW17_00039686 [Ensete ventricosum]|nr:hypothetical protein GW17_00039686 [Ensete ventricosum]
MTSSKPKGEHSWTLDRSCVGGSRIKRRLRTGLPQAADRSHCGSSRAGKRPPRAIEVVQATTSHANSGSPCMPAVASQRSTARRMHALAATQAATAEGEKIRVRAFSSMKEKL